MRVIVVKSVLRFVTSEFIGDGVLKKILKLVRLDCLLEYLDS